MEFFKYARIAEQIFYKDILKDYRWAYFVIAGCCFTLVYVFEAVALFTIAKREGFKNKWMAFVPILNTYYIGVVSEKNNILRFKAKHVALAAAVIEAVYIALNIFYYVAMAIIFKGGYAEPVYDIRYIGPYEVEVLTGYTQVTNFPLELQWAWWVFANIQNFVIYWVQLVYVILNVFVMIAFFRTYASQRYTLFSVLCILLPVKGIVMFAVRNNRAQNYIDYIKQMQQRRYYMYREYMRNNPPPQGGYGNVPPPPQGGMYNAPNGSEQSQGGRPDDPFGGLGEERKGQDNDPFDEFNN